MQSLRNPYFGFPYYPGISFNPSPLIGSISYPPLSAFIFGLAFRLYSLLGEPSRFLYYFLLKQPIVFSDIGSAIVLAKIVGLSSGARRARTSFLIWTYFPFGIITSSLWGALDPIVVFLVLLTVLYSTSRYVISAISLGTAIFLKTIPIIALPVILAQARMSGERRVAYSYVALGIPAIGTLVTIALLRWDVMPIFRVFSFQFDIQRYGGISPLGGPLLVSLLPAGLSLVAGIVWIPALVVAYLYSYSRKLPLLRSLLVVFLVFIISRPFVSEQWALYPLAMLVAMSGELDLKHFVGLSVPATALLVANNTLLLPFLSPISFSFAFYPLVLARLGPMTLATLLFFAESLLLLFGRESIVYGFLSRVYSRLNVHNLLNLSRILKRCWHGTVSQFPNDGPKWGIDRGIRSDLISKE